MKPKSGRIEYRPSHGKFTSPDELYRHVAFSGVPDIDYVERLVPVRSIVREQIAWISPWYRRTPSNIDQIERYYTAAERIGFTMSNQEAKHTTVGELDPLERFKLRICLALLARPEAELLIVDDIDQLRSLRLRAEFLQALRGLVLPARGRPWARRYLPSPRTMMLMALPTLPFKWVRRSVVPALRGHCIWFGSVFNRRWGSESVSHWFRAAQIRPREAAPGGDYGDHLAAAAVRRVVCVELLGPNRAD
ncbi:hypothetical protein [Corynebacterium kozikiae]|uniref:hypothetical protein n=1 Tax=Corynebacterium kozikiae TaxID=2968469 RepID=UPI00211B9B36|nr:hypothetical protein [Corynebacterium sp. 76QC2CO]MCQ9342523.1 hypothetical protein [Corynebacterium sp. 76QC2CO]